MPPLHNQRWERFAQALAAPSPPPLGKAYTDAGFKDDGSRAHASRLLRHPAVSKRIDELRAAAARILAVQAARADANAVTNINISRQSLLTDSATAFKLAEQQGNAQAMIQALRFMAELAHISLKSPEDKPQAQQHLHISLIDRPPNETLQQWTERKQQELQQRNPKMRVISSSKQDGET